MTVTYKEITAMAEQSIKCDRCGKEGDTEGNDLERQEFHQIAFTGGYSSVFGDGAQVCADLCQHCLKELIAPFARILPPNN